MDRTPDLSLPYLMAAQSQKHVTYNEAMRALDALVQPMVLDKDLAAPPGSPAEGDRYIVAAGPTGAWSGQAGKLAAWQDGAWAFHAPREGWLAWVADEDKPYVYTGSAWASAIPTALGYTPANKAGDAFTGNVIVEKTTNAELTVRSNGANAELKVYDLQDGGLTIFVQDGIAYCSRIGTGGSWVSNIWFMDLATGNIGFGGFPGERLSVEGVVAPLTDNAYSCGVSARRWDVVYAATGSINTSDGRLKTEVADADLGLAFIARLRPVSYRWAEGGRSVAWDDETYQEREPVTESRRTLERVVEMVGGVAVERLVEQAVEVPVIDRVPLVDEAGAPLLASDGQPRTHAAPRLRTVTRTRKVKREVPRPGTRRHYGLVAQDVKGVLDDMGVADFAGWVLDDRHDLASTQSLRYDQFIAPLIKAVQELAARQDAIANRLAALES